MITELVFIEHIPSRMHQPCRGSWRRFSGLETNFGGVCPVCRKLVPLDRVVVKGVRGAIYSFFGDGETVSDIFPAVLESSAVASRRLGSR